MYQMHHWILMNGTVFSKPRTAYLVNLIVINFFLMSKDINKNNRQISIWQVFQVC